MGNSNSPAERRAGLLPAENGCTLGSRIDECKWRGFTSSLIEKHIRYDENIVAFSTELSHKIPDADNISSASAISPYSILNACRRSTCGNPVESPATLMSLRRYCFRPGWHFQSNLVLFGVQGIHNRVKLRHELCFQIAPRRRPLATADDAPSSMFAVPHGAREGTRCTPAVRSEVA
jgi:hypothetical protein